MQPFIYYALIAATFWGVMSVVESVAGQHKLFGALLLKYVVYGIAGTVFLLVYKGAPALYTDTVDFARERPWLFALMCGAVAIGTLGAYYMYCSFDQCGDNKALAIILSYCVPLISVVFLSYFVLGERYNLYAVLGVAMIVGGVLVIDLLGADSNNT